MFSKGDHKTDLIKSVIIFATLTVIVIGAFGFYLFSNSQALVAKEVSRDSLYRLQHVRDYLETTVLKRYEELFQDKVVSTAFQKYDGLGLLLDEPNGNLGYRFLVLHNDIQNAKLAQEGLSNITVHFLKTGYTVDSRYIYEKPGNSKDAGFLGELSRFPLNRWTIRDGGEGERVMTYLQSLPYGSSHDNAKGYLYLDVSLDYVTGLLGGMLSSKEERFYIVDEDGKTLLTNSGQAAAGFDRSNELAGTAASVTVREEAGRTTVWAYSPASLSRFGWGFYVARPLDSLLIESKKLQHNLFVASIVAAVAGLAISLLMSRRVYVPLKKMMSNLQTLHRSLEKTRLLKLIHGDTEEAGSYSFAERSQFAVAYIRLRSGELDLGTLGQQFHNKPFQWDALAVSREELVVLFVLEPEEQGADATVKETLRSLQEELSGVCRFSAGYGRTTDRLALVSESFGEAKHAARYEFLFGPSAVVGFHEVEARRNALEDMNFERFEKGIHAQDMEAVSMYLEEFERTLIDGGCGIETAEWALMQLSVCMRRMALHYRLSDRLEIPDMSRTLKEGTLGEGLERIKVDVRQMIAWLSSDAPHAHAETINVIQRYIHEHLHEDISLDGVAELVSFSPSYISKLFAEVLHVPFIEYLSRARLELAAELLRDGQESVTRIAERAGYSNVQYFCTKFKAKYEVTPNQYRKLTRAAAVQTEVV
ncbi:hypothetical protein PAT3040_05765 [Paenibacillus agaridevorans]|uniref:HTH araC/xylS-type domain-containing protein n=1 Tax=Paenibacillus agaridevorans TaxID=171404 RepID=A0A2R5EWF4_9BACL|nr:helix-turn-helix domain-containing protein [Paenibacillus agaridevorans]GBG10990.1 hypothetical protein PAT3040_05765 [Paenibacillus agaridevorans]